jgi:predicted DNA-binding transcriptional regulator AlpA
MDDLKLIDTKALAKRLGKNVRTIQRWRKDGKLPIPIISGCRKCYWSESQFLNWMFATHVTLSDNSGQRNG